jgi:predicted Zn-dependent protease
MNKALLLLSLIVISFLNSCNIEKYDTGAQSIAILPFEDIEEEDIEIVRTTIEKFYGYDVNVLPISEMPINAYNSSDESYHIKSIFKFIFNKKNKELEVNQIIALVNAPIKRSNTNKAINYPILSKSDSRNNISIISIYSLKNTSVYAGQNEGRLKKITAHEIGRLLGLGYCEAHQKCLMQNFDNNFDILDNAHMKLCNGCSKKIGWSR